MNVNLFNFAKSNFLNHFTIMPRNMYRQDQFDYPRCGLALKVARVSKQLRQEDVAKELHVVRSTISRCERGEVVSPFTLFKYGTLVDVDILQFCYE